MKWVYRVDGSGRLRVENGNGGIVGTTVLTDDAWHHVACTFNGTTLSDVLLYVDGQLETISSNSATAINTDIVGGINVRISRGVNNRYFDGFIDDVRIWDTDLSDATIQNWMHKKLDASHPNTSNLQMHYLINAGSGANILDQSTNGNDATVLNGAIWQTSTGETHFKEFIEEGERPNITFVQGTYNLSITNDTTWMAVAQTPLVVRQTLITPHPGTIQSDEINYGPVNLYYNILPGARYYDSANALLQTVAVTPTANLNINSIPYMNRYPMDFEIMSFVTPYGIGLDLGQDG